MNESPVKIKITLNQWDNYGAFIGAKKVLDSISLSILMDGLAKTYETIEIIDGEHADEARTLLARSRECLTMKRPPSFNITETEFPQVGDTFIWLNSEGMIQRHTCLYVMRPSRPDANLTIFQFEPGNESWITLQDVIKAGGKVFQTWEDKLARILTPDGVGTEKKGDYLKELIQLVDSKKLIRQINE